MKNGWLDIMIRYRHRERVYFCSSSENRRRAGVFAGRGFRGWKPTRYPQSLANVAGVYAALSNIVNVLGKLRPAR